MNPENKNFSITLSSYGYHSSIKIGNYICYTPEIGKGNFSRVYIGHKINCTEKPPKYVAIKKINNNMKKLTVLSKIKSEINILKQLNHPNIIKYYDSFIDANNIYIVTEYCNHGNMDKFIKNQKLSEYEIKKYMFQFKQAMHYLVGNNILHRDIKPQNILLHKTDEDIILKLGDFGFARQIDSLKLSKIINVDKLCGTPVYLSPEILISKKYHINSDIWSIGILLYQLFFNSLPFDRPNSISELINNIKNMSLILYKSKTISEIAVDIILKMLEKDPDKRLSWTDFFEHEWFFQTNKNNNSFSIYDDDIDIIEKSYEHEVFTDLEKLLNKKQGQKYQMIETPIIIEHYYVPSSTSFPLEKKVNNLHINNSNYQLNETFQSDEPVSNDNSRIKSKPINIPVKNNNESRFNSYSMFESVTSYINQFNKLKII